MTTLLLPADEVAKIRALKGLVYVLAIMNLLDRHYPGRAFRPDEVAMIAGMDERTATKQLKDLSVMDRVILSGSGYVLTQGGRAMFLAPAESIEALALQSPDTMQAPQVQALQTIDVIPTEPPEPDPDTHTVRVLLEEEVNQSINLEEKSPSMDSSTQIVQPSTLQILEAVSMLFGTAMTTSGLEKKSKRAAIGWVAQAYDQRRHLNSPQGLIYSRLKSDQLPQEKYYNHPLDYLPDDYLIKLGLRTAKPAPQPEPDPETVEVEPIEEMDIEDTVNQPCPNVRTTPTQAWQSVLEQLQMEMHRAPFDTWVRDTKAVRFDGHTLTIGARNHYTCEWLTSRLQSTVERLLVGIMNQSVDVKFVVAELTAGE